MKLSDFIEKLKLALNSKTKYKKGGWGSHKKETWYFDCVCLIKAILWGWNANLKAKHGGAKYKSNGVPDIGTESMIQKCYHTSKDFKHIFIGELLYMKGHVGIYIGNGNVIEATKAWTGNVLMSQVNSNGIRSYKGNRKLKWEKHGFLPYINYDNLNTYPGIFPKLPKRGYFKKGDKGLQIKYLQEFLNWANSCKLQIDGILGNKTVSEVKKFQKKVNIKADGLFGKISLENAENYVK